MTHLSAVSRRAARAASASAWRAGCRALATSATIASSIGCGGTPPPAAAPSASLAVGPSTTTVAADLSEVGEPAELVALVRWKSPKATLDTISQWIGLRLSAADFMAEGLDRNIADILSFDAPVDVAIALDGENSAHGGMPLVAISIGARSLEEARRAATGATEVGPGQYRVNLSRGKRKAELPFCILSAAAGAAPARFVCGKRERDADALYPYLTRTLPRRDLGPADLHAELRIPPLYMTYGPLLKQGLRMGAAYIPRKLEVGEPAFDRVINRVALAVSEELGAVATDLDGLALDISAKPEQASAEIAVRLRGQESWTAGLLASNGKRADVPPPMFFRLPRSATSASYTRLPETRRLDSIRRTLGELLGGWLLHDGLDGADRAAIDGLFSDKYATDASWVSASGTFAPKATPPSAKAPARSNGAARAPADSDESGWYLAGIGATNQVADFVSAFAAAINRPKVQAYLKSKLADASSTTSAKSGAKTALLTLKLVPPAKELPKGGVDYELTVSREVFREWPELEPKHAPGAPGSAPPTTAKIHLLVVPESGGSTWLALGSDRTELTALVRAAIDGAPETDTLAARPEIAALKNDKVVGAGFTTLEAFIDPLLGPLLRDAHAGGPPRSKQTILSATPNKGKTPMVFRSQVTASDVLSFTLEVTVPRGAIEDGVILATTSAAFGALP